MLEGLKITGNNLVDAWIAKHQSAWNKPMVPALHFTVSTGAKKFRNSKSRVETMVVYIDCAEVDAMYLK
eukprot:3299932-Ditylum_brightwellii.AAC.1